jgi:hypothetical protein
MLKILHSWITICNFKIRQTHNTLKYKLEILNHANKTLKESIATYKKIIDFEQQAGKVRSGCSDLTR